MGFSRTLPYYYRNSIVVEMKLLKSKMHLIIKWIKRKRCKHEWSETFSSGYRQCVKCKLIVKA